MTGLQHIKSLFISTPGFVTIGLIFIHQSIIATSAIFLTRTIDGFQSGGAYADYLICYFLSMMTPYLPGHLSHISLQAWINRSHRNYLDKVIETIRYAKNSYRDAILRKKLESAVARSSFSIIKDSLSFAHGFISFFLNSLLSVLVIGVILPGNIFSGYLASVVICTLVIAITSKTIGRAAFKSEVSFIAYTETLSKIWPNITLGNEPNLAAWINLYNEKSSNYYRDKISLETKKQLANLTLSAFSLVPTVYLVYSAIHDHTTPGLIAAVIVNLTRIFHILGSLSALISDALECPAVYARLKILFDLRGDDVDATGQIAPEKININGEAIANLPEKLDELKRKSTGRFTVRGANGAGKSTVLLLLNDSLGDSAVYMPADHADLVWTAEVKAEQSTGQRTAEALRRVLDEEEITHLLLDEWDANLDAENTRLVDALIQEAAQTKVVVEVRH
jgi:ABC-type bacteriocin/lantibiotic exporter with double-glycine peptidase domain